MSQSGFFLIAGEGDEVSFSKVALMPAVSEAVEGFKARRCVEVGFEDDPDLLHAGRWSFCTRL